MLNCKDTTRLASEQLDRNLSLSERINFWMHILMCPFCRRFARHIGWLHSLLGRMAVLDDSELRNIGRQNPVNQQRLHKALANQNTRPD